MIIDRGILNIDKVICQNIDRFDASQRGLLSQNLLSQLRNFVEYISLKVYAKDEDIKIDYENIEKAIQYIKSNGKFRFLSKFHKLLQSSVSHYTLDEENSERLMLKYYEYLLKTKTFLKEEYNLDVLNNIEKFPINQDLSLKEYYEKIVEKINRISDKNSLSISSERFYIQKIKPLFVNNNIYYEVTLTIANDKTSKFDRIIAFTKLDITHNYATKLKIKNDFINIFGKNIPILLIVDWEVSIRPCELNNFARIFGIDSRLQSGYKEYQELMKYLTETSLNLVEVICFPEYEFSQFTRRITNKLKVTDTPFMNVLKKCRQLIINQRPGSNVIRYLLYRLNNKIIKQQYSNEYCEKLSNLYLDFRCIPFDDIPFNTSLKNHNPKLLDLLDCIETDNREHEFFARLIKNNTEINGELYTKINDIKGFENFEELMEIYNSKLYYKHSHRRLERFKSFLYIKGYEDNTLKIIQKLKDLASSGIKSYSNAVRFWLDNSNYYVDCDEKRKALIQMFEHSRVALIYGSAGTGKSTMINHISNFFNREKKLYLANTNPAVDNLKRKIKANNCTFKTIAKFLAQKNIETKYDILVIDECSTVSNLDVIKVLNKADFKLLVLVGDPFQIDSIYFGNWFDISQEFVPKTSVFELTKPYRSSEKELLTLWEKVRWMEDDIQEHMARNEFSSSLNDSIYEKNDDDEIILCLNYDGLYGINNINRILQSNNKSEAIQWGIHTYKVNDPILFNESERFSPLIYNNLKGNIVDIQVYDNKIRFDIEIEKVIHQLEAEDYDLELIGESGDGRSIIRFYVHKYESTDFDNDDLSSVVPFQVAYAVSIHKAQGLEYNSVKIVITDEVEEMITHNIFYTAITRAKKQLKIYWTPETEYKVISNMKRKDIKQDLYLLKSRLGQLVN